MWMRLQPLKMVLLYLRMGQDPKRVSELQVCAVSIMHIRSSAWRAVSSVLYGSNYMCTCILVVQISQLNGRVVAQGGYCIPLVLFRSALLVKDVQLLCFGGGRECGKVRLRDK